MSIPQDTNITVTIDTDNLNDSNKNLKVVFSDDLGDPEQPPGHPEKYVSIVYENQKITWTALAKNGRSTIYFQNVKFDGGSRIIKDVKRGQGVNTYTANIVNIGVIRKDEEEEYSITFSLSGYEGIAGSNENGPMVFLGNAVAYMDSYKDNVWYQIAPAPFEIEGITGYNSEGPIIYSGKRVAYMDGYKNNTWNELIRAPFKIEGIAGNNGSKGVLAYSGNRVAYLNYKSGSTWVELNPAPFDIEGITGDYYGGPIVFSGKALAFMDSYKVNEWNNIYDVPFYIEGVKGTIHNGIVLYAGNQVAYTNGLNVESSFNSVAEAPFLIEGIAGNGVRGPIVFSGSKVSYMSNYNTNKWYNIADTPFTPQTFTVDPKLRLKGRVR